MRRGVGAFPLSVFVFINFCTWPTFTRTSFVSDTHGHKRPTTPSYQFRSCQVYCYGPLLHTIQMAHLFDDSKTFVDMKLKHSPEETMMNFNQLMESKNNQPSESDLRGFLKTNFDELGKEFIPWKPRDWKESPAFLSEIRDSGLKHFASDLHSIWKDLGRQMVTNVHKQPEKYSIIPIINPVIVPGGRFIEFYYWDSYWIIRGLLYSEMFDTARGMLENFLSIVDRVSFIPNGGRIYYSNRSQPPLLPGMIKSFVEFTNDKNFAIKSVGLLEREFEYWMNNHTVQAKGRNMAAYKSISAGPRPESYREDIETAQIFPTAAEKESFYAELKAGAESGMDFTSRWFINDEGTNIGNLTNLKTRSIVPVELNAILYGNAKIIAEFYRIAGNLIKYHKFMKKADDILEDIQAVHWNEEVGAWLDYDLIHNKHRNYFVPTNLSPLWMKAYNQSDAAKISEKVLKYIDRLHLDSFPGGVPNTLYRTGEQWDFPNVWPPMQYILIEGLNNLDTPEAKALSEKWCHRWVKSNFKAYHDTNAMFEKYNAEKFGGSGGGGEYVIQKGFGWTNGVIIELLAKYGGNIMLNNGSSKKFFLMAEGSYLLALSIIFGVLM